MGGSAIQHFFTQCIFNPVFTALAHTEIMYRTIQRILCLLFETFLRAISILHMVTHMNKYVIILGGIIAIIIGLLTLIPSPGLGWYKELIVLIKGGIGLLLILIGAVAIFLGKD